MDWIAFIVGLGVIAVIAIIIFLVLSYLFWIWMFIDAVKKRDVMWIVLFVVSALTGFLSGVLATIYYFVEYKKK